MRLCGGRGRPKEKVAVLEAENERLGTENAHLKDENDRLAMEIARLSAQKIGLEPDRPPACPLPPDQANAPTETEGVRWKRSGRRRRPVPGTEMKPGISPPTGDPGRALLRL